MFKSLDHIAIVVHHTDEALRFYRDQLGFPVVVDQVIDDAGVRLTHLDLGNVHLQLVQPMHDHHPLHKHLEEHGEGLHHLCFYVDDVDKTISQLPERNIQAMAKPPHSGPNGRKAAFLDPETTRGVLWELTSDPEPET